ELVGTVEEAEQLLLLGRLRHVADIDGACRNAGGPFGGEAHEGMRLTAADPVGWDADEAAAIAVELAALDREPQFRAAGKAHDDLEIGLEGEHQGLAVDVVACTRAGG